MLATAMWPSTRDNTAGWSPVTASISWRVGSFSPTQSVWSQPPPTIQSADVSRFGMVGDALLHLGQRLHADEIDLQHLPAAVGEMHVRVVEAGHDEVSAEIDDLRVFALQLANVVVGADGDDAAVANRHRLGSSGHSFGVDVAVEKDNVGRTSALGIAGCGFA